MGWKEKVLNRNERATLAKSIFEVIPAYTEQNVWVPKGVCNNIDAYIRSFIRDNPHTHFVTSHFFHKIN